MKPQSKYKPVHDEWHRHKMIQCPLCKHPSSFEDVSYSGEFGTEEQHSHCHRCGYFVEQCYSPVYTGIVDYFRGHKTCDGGYITSNRRKHKRIRRRLHISGKDIGINLPWFYQI